MEAWKKAFKEIHGKTPVKGDYQYASSLVRSQLPKTLRTSPRKKPKGTPVKIKRPADGEPSEPKLKKRRLFAGSNCKENHSPLKQSTSSLALCSPVKSDCFTDIQVSNCLRRSPRKHLSSLLPRSGFQRSPLKPIVLSKSNVCRNLSGLAPRCKADDNEEKKLSDCDLGPDLAQWPDEKFQETCEKAASDANQKTGENQPGPSESLPVGTDKPDAAVGKKASNATRKSRKKPKENFIRLNMKKKCYVRGHVNAQTKRKKWRREKYKKR